MSVLLPFGPNALRIALSDALRADVSGRAALAARLLALPDVEDAALTETAALLRITPMAAPGARAELEAAVRRALLATSAAPAALAATRTIDVIYDGADLHEVAHALGRHRDEIVARHAARTLRVSFLGFVPGFAYLRGLDPVLETVARRPSPRPRVPAGSVALAAGMSAVYPAASPGGWQLLGRAVGFDPLVAPLRPADLVSFREVSADDAPALPAPSRRETSGDAVEIASVVGVVLVVDGRPRRRLSDGAPQGGPLVGDLADRALAAVGGSPDDALLERYGDVAITLVSGPPRHLADERGHVVRLAPGATARFAASPARVGYVAIEGGLDVPELLGGRGTLLSIARGGHEGRPLRRGDRIAVGGARGAAASVTGLLAPIARERVGVLRARRGPELATDHATEVVVRIGHASDRTGTRLVPTAAHGLSLLPASSAPMIRGAIQAPPSGELVVLGPDHPVTGGYPVVGVLDDEACDALFSLPIASTLTLGIG